MQRDFRKTPHYHEAAGIIETLRRPGTGVISDAAEVSTNGLNAAFAGTMVDTLSGVPPTRVCVTNLATGDTRVLTFGPNIDRLPKYSPDGAHIAFLSDRHKLSDFQLYLLDPASGVARPAPRVKGWVEYLHWSPDGARILLGVAGHGADVSGAQGSVTTKTGDSIAPWMPTVDTGIEEEYRWRRAWVYELATDSVQPIGCTDNIWEAVWCGNHALAAVLSPGPGEGLWYSARLHIVAIETGESREVYASKDQMGWPAASPSGGNLAIVEAICSDRSVVAGDLRLIESTSGNVTRVDTLGVDITYAEWRSDRRLLLAGHRGFETVVGAYEMNSGEFNEMWSSRDTTSVGRYISVSGLNETADCVLVAEGFMRAPEIAVIRAGKFYTVKSFDLNYTDQVNQIAAAKPLSWKAPDGLQIEGWLLQPKSKGPYPLVMYIHGGPVGHWRPYWLVRRGADVLMLLRRGYAVFLPNPRGSAGRGQSFARHVLGDMGGADTYDYLSGLDYLVELGIADPRRLGVTGLSYGGFMAAWLITQDARFAAAVPVAPITNQVTEHLISNIPDFTSKFLNDHYKNAQGKYFHRSPIMYAHKTRTPTLNICGALDRSTPAEEAVQFHNALLENRVKSVLVTYPEEGHGVRRLPALIDYAARLVAWFEEHMPPETQN